MRGHERFEDIIKKVHGADPKLVNKLYRKILRECTGHSKKTEYQKLEENARGLNAYLPLSLPAPDPLRSQWWFTLESIVKIAEKILEFSIDEPVAFLGAPTVGHYYSHCEYSKTTILDVDSEVIQSLTLPDNASAVCYDVLEEVPRQLKGINRVVFLDPPWQPLEIGIFINRAFDLLSDNGYLFTILPPQYTRSSTVEERNSILKRMLDGGMQIISLETEYVEYRVPYFEGSVMKQIPASDIKPWRKGELLIAKYSSGCSFEYKAPLGVDKIMSFSRDLKRLRFFQFVDRETDSIDNFVEPIEEFGEQLSSRKIPLEKIAIWGTNKKAVNISDAKIAAKILGKWQNGNALKHTITLIKNEGVDKHVANSFVNRLNDYLGLWKDEVRNSKRRFPEEISKLNKESLGDFCAKPTDRFHKSKFIDDGFRISFQRDRDRILWSNSLKRLSNKSQVFPVESGDHLRRRLSHSIEVMQLASTIATSFGLDPYLTEAGALAHDIGHAPFGHAGESALDSIFYKITNEKFGFNHYEHGVDIVFWLEDVYTAPAAGGFGGLNLCPETIECIFKHTFDRNTQRKNFNSSKYKHEYYKDTLDDSACHLEGQAIRISDKISYLLSDIEDGIRMDIFKLEDLMKCVFFHHPPIDMLPPPTVSLLDQFISQRRSILKVVMEDVLLETDRRLSKYRNLEEIRTDEDYVVFYSKVLEQEIAEIWNILQAGLLHKDPRVKLSNMKTARIINDLFLVFTFFPELVSRSFTNSHDQLKSKHYGQYYEKEMGSEIGVPKRLLLNYHLEKIIDKETRSEGDNYIIRSWDVVRAKDYVASLSDTSAFSEYRKHLVI